MTRRDLAWRCSGVVALFGAGGSSLLHRGVLAAHVGGPASPLEIALGLISFVLCSLGILLLWHGADLHDGWARECRHGQGNDQEAHAGLNEIECDPDALSDGRAAIATSLANRAIGAVANSERGSHPPGCVKAG